MAFDGKVRPQVNASVREYARLEFRAEDLHWVLASARMERRTRPARRLAWFARKPVPAPRPVACKGSPRRTPAEGPTPG